ncbi:MAG: hypothetical protein WA989_12665 [Henriciella sp.]|uniref:hypothetical protein n=1 Tax=Henriciella sp. TaxID=1968823 RepID=UPI003C754CD4
MRTSNRDVFPAEATLSIHEPISGLLETPELDQEFLRRDAIAMKAKRRFHTFGQSAIVLIAVSAIYTIAETLLFSDWAYRNITSLIAVLMAGIGIGFQAYIMLTDQKPKWLLNRYAVERLRSLKFQAFALAQEAKDSAALRAAANDHARRGLALLQNELNAGIAVVRTFSPARAMIVHPKTRKPVNPEITAEARAAYGDLRVDYQKRFAQSELESFSSRRRLLSSSQDIIYLCAATFAFLALGAKLASHFGMDFQTAWIDFMAVCFFILGATEAIMDNATLEEQSRTRYEQYVRDIEALAAKAESKTVPLSQIVADMERLSLEELDKFCRAATRISYRF